MSEVLKGVTPQCGAYLWLRDNEDEYGFQLKIECDQPLHHGGDHTSASANRYCFPDIDHALIIRWYGDDGEADRAREAEWEHKRAAEEEQRARAEKQAKDARRAWQASDEARQEFIEQAALWLHMTPEQTARLVERCPCNEYNCTGWRLISGGEGKLLT